MSGPLPAGGDRCGWPQAILFDLDGTLIDSAPDIANAVNELLAGEGHASLTLAEVRSMIGNGVKKLVERAFAARGVTLAGNDLDHMTETMMGIYARHLTGETVLMPGAAQLLSALAKAGVRIAVVTNKPEGFSRTILQELGLGENVHAVVGGDTGPTRKPAPDMLLHALDIFRLPASRALMVGDSPADIDAAKAAGIASLAVRGGYTNISVENLGANLVIDSLVEVPHAIEMLKEPV